MEKYLVEHDRMLQDQEEYKKAYPPFCPYVAGEAVAQQLAQRFLNVVTTQNGQDTDDYYVGENHKVYRYTSHLRKGSKLLLLGVGTGREILAAQSIGLDVWGTTLGSRNVYFGIHHLGLSPDRLIETLNEILPFEPGFFDAVHGYQMLEHTIAPLLFLLEAGRVLKEGGEIFLEWPPANTHTMDDNPHHQVCFSPGQARGLLLKAGFRDIELSDCEGKPIREEDVWFSSDSVVGPSLEGKGLPSYFCARARKSPPQQEYIRRARSYKRSEETETNKLLRFSPKIWVDGTLGVSLGDDGLAACNTWLEDVSGLSYSKVDKELARLGNVPGCHSPLLLVFAGLILNGGIRNVLEFGSGMSTFFLLRLLEKVGGKLVTIEQHQKWFDLNQEVLKAIGSQHRGYTLSPLVVEKQGGGYAPVVELGREKVDLVFVDSAGWRLEAATAYRSSYSSDCILIFDDCEQPKKEEEVRQWAQKVGCGSFQGVFMSWSRGEAVVDPTKKTLDFVSFR